MKSILFLAALVSVILLSSCSASSRYATRPASPYRYNGSYATRHIDNNRTYNSGHGTNYGTSTHGRRARRVHH